MDMNAGVIQKARVVGSKPGAVKLNSFGPLGDNLQHLEIDSKCRSVTHFVKRFVLTIYKLENPTSLSLS